MNGTLPAPRCIIDKVTAVHRLTVLTLNVHWGSFCFGFVLPDREVTQLSRRTTCGWFIQ